MQDKAGSGKLINILFEKRITEEQIYDIALILYLCSPAITFFIEEALELVGLKGVGVARFVIIILICFLAVINALSRNRMQIDFWVIWAAAVCFLLISYIIHPEYEPWYTREEYGVWDYVLSPENGIYIYLFLRLVNDPKRIIHCIKISAWPMYLTYLAFIRHAHSVGYWADTSNYGYEIHLSYNLSLGYNLLLFCIVFLYCAFEKKKLSDIAGAAIGIFMILIAGSRGPILDIGIFVILYVLIRLKRKQRALFLSFGAAVGVLVCFFYKDLLVPVMSLMERFNLSSRFLNKLLNDSILDGSGRNKIWAEAVDMIHKNPLGYGAMGSRHILNKYIFVAHPHNFFLEILIDFGVVIGSVIFLLLLYWTVRLFTIKGCEIWKGVFLIFFARACQLLVSATHWHSIGLWGAMAVGVCMWQSYKRERKSYNVR